MNRSRPQSSSAEAAASENPDQIREEIARTRTELGDTVEALSAKADVKARARRQFAKTKGRAQERLGKTKGRAEELAGPTKGAAMDVAKGAAAGGGVAAVLMALFLAMRARRG